MSRYAIDEPIDRDEDTERVEPCPCGCGCFLSDDYPAHVACCDEHVTRHREAA